MAVPWATVVQRLRLPDDGLDEAVGEIRELVRSRGRAACTWEVAAAPRRRPTCASGFLELGCVPDREPYAVGMVLRRPPEWDETPGVVARRVETVEELRLSVEIAAAFETPDHERDEVLADVERRFREQGVRGATYLAWVDGEPVAQAYAAFTEHGLLLFGGGTLPGSRGRGAYRALVRDGGRTQSPGARRRS